MRRSTEQWDLTYRNHSVVGKVEANEEKSNSGFSVISLVAQNLIRNKDTELVHGILLPLAEQGPGDAPLVGLPDGPFLGQVNQQLHGSLESPTTLHPLCLVRVVRQEHVAVGDVLKNLVLTVGLVELGINCSDLVTEAKEVSDTLCDYGNRKTICPKASQTFFV